MHVCVCVCLCVCVTVLAKCTLSGSLLVRLVLNFSIGLHCQLVLMRLIWPDGTEHKSRSLSTTHWCLFWLLMAREFQKQKTLCKVIYFHSSLSEQLGATPSPTVWQMRTVTILEAMFLVAAGNGPESICASKLPFKERLSCAGLRDHLFPCSASVCLIPAGKFSKIWMTSAAPAPAFPFPSGLVVKIHPCCCVWNVVHRLSSAVECSFITRLQHPMCPNVVSPQTSMFSHMPVPVSQKTGMSVNSIHKNRTAKSWLCFLMISRTKWRCLFSRESECQGYRHCMKRENLTSFFFLLKDYAILEWLVFFFLMFGRIYPEDNLCLEFFLWDSLKHLFSSLLPYY